MHKRNLVSLGLLSILAAAGTASVAVVGCSGDDAATDAGPDQITSDQINPPPDTGTPDTGTDAGTPRARLTVVHASPAAGIVRICFAIRSTTDAGTVDTIAPFLPLPHSRTAGQIAAGQPYPGLPPGFGGPLSDTGSNLEVLTIVPYVINAAKVAQYSREDGGTPTACDELLKPDAGVALVENQDYWKLAPIPAGTFKAGKAYIVAAVGCPKYSATLFGGEAQAKVKCGTDYTDDDGNLGAKVFEVSKTVPNANQIGAQFLHLSPVVQNVPSLGPDGVVAVFKEGDASTPINPTPSKYLDNAAPATPTAATVSANGILIANAIAGDASTPVPMPLAAVSQLSTGSNTFAYVNGNSYTFIALGDPTLPSYINPLDGGPLAPDAGGVFNGRSIHFLGFPNEFTPPKY
jgi:hypothetical protein